VVPRVARTSLLAVAGLVGALVGSTPAQAVPDGAVVLFEPSTTDSAQSLQILGITSAGMAWAGGFAEGVWVQPTGADAVLDDALVFPEMVGDLITEVSDDYSTVTWRTIADPEIHTHAVPEDVDYWARTATGYVGTTGTGPYQIVRVNLLDGGEPTVVGTSAADIGNLVTSSLGVTAMTSSGYWRYFAFTSAGADYTGKALTTPARYLECPWLSRAHLFCYSDTGLYRIPLGTGTTTTASALPLTMIETPDGVAYLDESGPESLTLKTWASTATTPVGRISGTWGLNGSLVPSTTPGAVLVGRTGPIGTAGIWSVPLAAGTSPTKVMAAPAEPRRAGWTVALSPGSVAWTDNSARSGNLWTRDLDADGVPTGENRLLSDHADDTTLSAAAGRFTYTANGADGSSFYPEGIQLVDGDKITPVAEDEDGWTAVLSGDRLLTESMSYFAEDSVWRLRDLRTGTVTVLGDAMDYDLWGERLVRLDDDGRIRLYDLRGGVAPVELRAAQPDGWLFGSVYVAGDVVAWDIFDLSDFSGLTGERATRNVATMDPATIREDLDGIGDLSTGYLLGGTCTGPYDCVTKAVALDDGQVTELGEDYGAVDGNVFAGIDAAGMPYVQTLPGYTDAPRLLQHPNPTAVAGPGRTWKARIVTSRVLSACAVEIRDAEDAVVRSLNCADPHAAATVTWDGTDELGDPLAAGDYTWHVVGSTGAENLVDYDGDAAALSGDLTVTDDPVPTIAGTTVPADAALKVSQASNVKATFSEAVQGVSATTFRLRSPSGTVVPAAVTYDAASKTATLNPTASLAADTAYTATLTGGETAIRDGANGPLETVSWSFTTGPVPTVGTLTPASNGTAASVSANLTAVFSEKVAGVGSTTFQLTKAVGGTVVPGAVAYTSTTKTATFNPTSYLLPDTRYTATLTGGESAIRDLAGNPLTTKTWSFTTGPAPTVTSTTPAANATGVGRTANVVAAFSEAVTGVSSSTVKLRTSSGSTVSAVVSYSATSRKVTLNPSATLAASTKYTVTLTGGTTAIRDAAGNPLTTKTWSFTTGS
jgi:hypothetical protein